jgi:hypothetical protein
MSDKKPKNELKKEEVDKEMLENLDILLNMDVLESEEDWPHIEDEDTKNDKT